MVHIKEQLLARFADKSALIGIVGLGYVGLPLVLRFTELGFKVVGIDIDPQKVNQLNDRQSYIGHIDAAMIAQACDSGFVATTDFAESTHCDVLILCVPTPLNDFREPDLSFVIATMDAIVPHLRPGQMLALESTTYPGTTAEILYPRIAQTQLRVGEEFFLVYAPEREDPGNPHFPMRTIPRICSGYTAHCLEVAQALYAHVVETVVPVSSTQTAEMAKLLENIHRAVNIGLVNEMKMVADKMGIDIYEVIRAAATKPFGFVPYYPGPGIGGHCIPIDPFYLTWKAREVGMHTHFIELAGEINQQMPTWVVHKIADALNEQGLAIKHSRILLLGISYKENVDDMRESPAVVIMELLRDKGAHLAYSDPHVPTIPKMRKHHLELSSIPITEHALAQFDCVVITTAHRAFDYELIKQHARLIVDTRGVYQSRAPHIISA
jgi:UDP-N-acetyl-D-glucosamine dehydrogenase